MEKKSPFQYVAHRWNDAEGNARNGVEQLVYRSNLLGADQSITNTGGGNTSAKIIERDPLTGDSVEVLWVKGSGGDLRTSTKSNFASLYQEKLLALQSVYSGSEPRGPKTASEDAMVGMYPHCTFNLNPRAASIDTPLHAFIPHKHVDHMHPNSVIAVAAAKNGERLAKEIFGDDIAWTPWQRPGFDLGLKLRELCATHPRAKGAVLGKHGLINWADDSKACYDLTLALIDRAADFIKKKEKGTNTFGGQRYQTLSTAQQRHMLTQLLPWLRGTVSQQRRMVATIEQSPAIMEFVNSADAPRLSSLGTSCPDHFLRTKIKPLFVDWNPQKEDGTALRAKLSAGILQYRKDYAEYYERCRRPDSPAMRDPNPTVMLIPGLGMVAWGKDKSESRVTAEFYNCAVEVMRGAEAIDEYTALPQQEAFDIEYWLLEEAKLKRMPPEKELARQVIVVIGAGSGIGRVVCHRLAAEGAHIVCADLDRAAAEATAKELTDRYGMGIGVAGTGVSSCGPAIGLPADVTNRDGIQALFEETLLAYGGIDGLVVTAGIFVPPDLSGRIPDQKWLQTFSINTVGPYFVADQAAPIFREQNLRANLVVTTSVNAVVPKKGSVAYDASKAAANHIIRELAIELAPLVRVNGVAPATVVEGSSMFPRDRVMASLTKYKIPYDAADSTEALREKLAGFYADRTLTKQSITPADQAEAVFLLLSNRLSKTTGQILSVDGGLPDAFLR
jgi:rhamnulose-1-phosphate aldolase/alcohol dehydrogenase